MVPIYCITFTVFISFIIFLIMKVIKKKNYTYPLIILVFALIYRKNWINLYKESINFTRTNNPLKIYSDIDCIFIYRFIKHTTYMTFYMQNCKRIKFIGEKKY